MQGNDQNNNQIGDQPIVEPVLPFIPKIQNPNSQISAGGIESGPIRVESPVISADLKLPELEKPAENIERMEVKEPKTPVPVSTQVPVVQSDDKNDKKDDEKEEKKEEKLMMFEPKYSGHKIDPSMYLDTDEIRKNAGKGDPSIARTAILILLDRLFKKGVKL